MRRAISLALSLVTLACAHAEALAVDEFPRIPLCIGSSGIDCVRDAKTLFISGTLLRLEDIGVDCARPSGGRERLVAAGHIDVQKIGLDAHGRTRAIVR